jgi:hypothetical protein
MLASICEKNWIQIGAHQESPGHDRRDKDKKPELKEPELQKQRLEEPRLKK